MALPRYAALAEVQWHNPKDAKNYSAFLQRLLRLINIYQLEGYNYAKHIFNVRAEVKPEVGDIKVTFSCLENTPIYYTTDGTEPTKNATVYTQPLKITKTTDLKAKAFGSESLSSTRLLFAL